MTQLAFAVTRAVPSCSSSLFAPSSAPPTMPPTYSLPST